MKLAKWEKDLCKAFWNMYLAKNMEVSINEAEYEISRVMGNLNADHRETIHNYLITIAI